MERYGLDTKQAAVNFTLKLAAGKPMSLDEERAMRGTGWDGDLEAMRAGRIEHL